MAYLIPEKIETDRLVLRTFREEDWQDLFVLYADAEATRYTIRQALDEYDTWRTLAGFIGHWKLRSYGPYAVEQKSSGRVLGHVGLWYPLAWPEPEIMWSLARPYWGQGFASEAARAVKAMAADSLPGLSLISLIDENNLPSIRLAESLGAELEKKMVFKEHLVCIYRHRP